MNGGRHTLVVGTRLLCDYPQREAFEQRIRLFFSLQEENGGGFAALPASGGYVGPFLNATVRLVLRELWAAGRECAFHTPTWPGSPVSWPLPKAEEDIPVCEYPFLLRCPPVYDADGNDVMEMPAMSWLFQEMQMLARLWQDSVCVIAGLVDERETGMRDMVHCFERMYKSIPVYYF